MFQDFKPVLKILLRFIVIYVVLIFLYQLYLNSQTGLDSASVAVGQQVCFVQEAFGIKSELREVPQAKTAYFVMNGQSPTRMVEGCNAISIMILFLAFIFAFYKGKTTFIFSMVGLVLLYVMNVLRIAGLNMLYFQSPEYFEIGHQYLFPAVIYGTVVVLWLVWIKFFALKKS